ncbi:MAG: hypothetical protein J5532_04995 [Lachnospiraceae bacterium]|nr:hypothetical protein [Lachnospiraceae bacterium]
MFEVSHDTARKLIKILAFVVMAYVAILWICPSLIYRESVTELTELREEVYGFFHCLVLFAIEELGIVLVAFLLTMFVTLCEDISHMRRINDLAPHAKEPLIRYTEPYKSASSEEESEEE